MHTTIAVGANRIPLGIPRIEYDATDGKAEKGRPPEDRKSAHIWRSISHASERNSARGRTAKAKRARVAEVALRWESFELAPPAKTSEFEGAKPVRLSAVHALEETDLSDGSPKLEWIPLTSLDAGSRRDALRALGWYRLRWRIEDWHRILKCGCRAEYLNHQAGERIERAATI